MRLYLHIGGPKTGTTSFQAALTRPGALNGTPFWTPNIGQVNNGGHHILIRNLLGIHDTPVQWVDPIRALREWAADKDGAAIITSEFCDRLATFFPHAFLRLLEHLGEVFNEIIIVKMWRDFSTFLSSYYQQTLCNFVHGDTFDVSFQKRLEVERMHIAASLARYNTGHECINLAFRDEDDEFDTIDTLSRAIGVKFAQPEDGSPKPKVFNVRRSLARVAATSWLINEAGLTPERISKGHVRLIHSAIASGVNARGGDVHKFQGMTPELLMESRAQNQSLRERYSAQTWGKSWDEATAAVDQVTPCDLSPGHLPADSAKIAREVVDDLKPQLPKIFATPLQSKDHEISHEKTEERLSQLNKLATRRPVWRPKASRKLILHIGSHSTGTSSFQALLTPTANQLEQSDLWAPDFGQGRDGAHHHLIYRLIGAWSKLDQMDAEAELRLRVAMESRTCVISSEFLHDLIMFKPEVFNALIRQLQTLFNEISIVQVIGETRALINSHYQKNVCNFIQNDDFGSFAKDYMLMERQILRCAKDVSDLGVTVKSIPFRPHLSDFDADLFMANEVGLTPTLHAAPKHEGYPLSQMVVSHMMMKNGDVPFEDMNHSQRFAAHNAVAMAVSPKVSNARFQGFTPDLEAEIRDTNTTQRDQFAKENWSMTWDETFGSTPLGPYQPLEVASLPDDCRGDVERIMHTLPAKMSDVIANCLNPARQSWDVTIKRQYQQLSMLNRAAKIVEVAAAEL